ESDHGTRYRERHAEHHDQEPSFDDDWVARTELNDDATTVDVRPKGAEGDEECTNLLLTAACIMESNQSAGQSDGDSDTDHEDSRNLHASTVMGP
ncbi:MAG TPA: hypothetical protein VFM66_00380, partial [Agromyces sp.]|nr:hypothetical protein [Agromyces sp.]